MVRQGTHPSAGKKYIDLHFLRKKAEATGRQGSYSGPCHSMFVIPKKNQGISRNTIDLLAIYNIGGGD